jgi:ATP-dependent helicase HrpB
LDLVEVLRGALGWERSQRLDRLAPTRLATPAGTERPIDYADASGEPVLKAPLQELFGAAQTPAIWSGRQPLTLHLLSPAGRPLQVTRDLSAFWRGAYAEVRKEMRGRYPKHHWPEDPATSPAVKGGLKRHLS